MTVSIFAGCTEACGWFAAMIGVFCFGSYGVPIKSASNVVEVDPFVMQSYKTLVCFLSCWLVVFLGEDIRWTNWGIVSGFFWVPSAACGIYGIRNAGLATAVGVWASSNVIMSFIWGILIFEEPVKNVTQTALAFTTLGIGLVGMSQFSKPPKKAISEIMEQEEEQSEEDLETAKGKIKPIPNVDKVALLKKSKKIDRYFFFGGRLSLTRRQLGIVGAMINGTWGGLNLIPLHFAKKEGFGGAAYLISYSCGSMIVNTAMWVVYFVYFLHRRQYNFEDALESLPEWHWDKLWLPGFLAGGLYSMGNFGSILAVTYLGQGVGFSLCQVQILVSGLWGIVYFGEIRGRETIMKWLISACVTVIGILWLTREHGSSGGH